MYQQKRDSKKQPPPKKKIIHSKVFFENAFSRRVGQSPAEFIQMKLKGGSDIQSVHYLYELTADAIAHENKCESYPFEMYYSERRKEKSMSKVIQYNKLVRDKIPDIIENSGKQCTTEVLSQERYIEMLDAKLQEELSEYQKSKALEELADLLEVMGAVVRARGYTWEQLTEVRKAKREKRGGFEKKILLKEVIEK